jgi:hypothetical protein
MFFLIVRAYGDAAAAVAVNVDKVEDPLIFQVGAAFNFAIWSPASPEIRREGVITRYGEAE